ncbi:hypothetical protein P691DRAFT_841419, partial [Macrolepiota fuliginosa MF-IS2]
MCLLLGPTIYPGTTGPGHIFLTKEKKVPLLWKVLVDRYSGKLESAAHRGEDGGTTRDLGFDEKVKVLVYPSGSSTPAKYEAGLGATKLESLTKFSDSILDGTVDLKIPNGEKTTERAEDEL